VLTVTPPGLPFIPQTWIKACSELVKKELRPCGKYKHNATEEIINSISNCIGLDSKVNREFSSQKERKRGVKKERPDLDLNKESPAEGYRLRL